ncbi:MAG: hypothetical protein K0S12_1378 [Bacteroidetes bacterium]|jgi:hypothetical protein|nr:hypothetical protein [Bacteroidota bacterium]
MKQLFFAASVLTGFIANAQQTITGTSPVGYSATIAIASAATASTVPLTTGAGVTWNCSNLATSVPNATLSYNSPTGKPFAGDYPSSNYHLEVTLSGSVMVNEFYVLNGDSLVKLGGHVAGSPYEIYSNPQIDMKFPFSFNDVFTDNYAKTSYNANGSVSSTQTGSVTLTYEGYGTLILPGGTYTNVALVKRVRTNSIGPTTTSYDWIAFPSGNKLMGYDTNGGLKVNYVTSISTGIPQYDGSDKFQVYPTVTEGEIIIKSTEEIGTVKVYSSSGQLIQSHENTSSLQLSAPAGIYFIEISSRNGVSKAIRKIVLN